MLNSVRINKRDLLDFSKVGEYDFNTHCLKEGMLNKVIIFKDSFYQKVNADLFQWKREEDQINFIEGENYILDFNNFEEKLFLWLLENDLSKEFEEFSIRCIGKKEASEVLLRYFYCKKHMDKIKFLFIENFDTGFSPNISRKLYEDLLSYKNVQVVITTHNSYLASLDFTRPDCCFRLKESGRLKSFMEATDREIKQGHNLEKLLRFGEFDN